MSRLEKQYHETIRPQLMKDLEIENVWAVPRMQKVVVNMGVGEASQNIKLLDAAIEELAAITGQRPVMRRARKSIAAFKLREGQPVGATVTLRGKRMYEFIDRLVNVALPRVRDFRGVPTKAFDGRGNYTMGLEDQLIFPEIDYSRVSQSRGMNITFVTTLAERSGARRLLELLGCRSAATDSTGRQTFGQQIRHRQDAAQTEIQGSREEPLPELREAAGVSEKFRLCRLCFRKLALAGTSPA
jgi:large subunit ribosomal protein L5